MKKTIKEILDIKIHITLKDMIIAALTGIILLFVYLGQYDPNKCNNVSAARMDFETRCEGEKLTQDGYYDLYSKLLDQKQQSYDSAVNHLNYWAGALGVVFTAILGIAIFIGVYEIRVIKGELKVGKELNERIAIEAKRLVDIVTADKYEGDISLLKERADNLETLAAEIIESYVVRFDRTMPIPKVTPKRERRDPFANA